ncbi:F-box protein [Pyrus ussuriensis x Pyrus communis]|uniref:F-box protein n=1 Tax=Pyrus ussuriensis x Pyrus communis TaxID=2448454 RepID=A0A5N5H291_9ROSA|nr:F-box protein [Pyrus ussuriensis x Pyrus communis]
MARKRKLQAPTSCESEGTCSESGMDRFSDLPEEVVHRILSFLNFKDLTRVGAVSKQCRQFRLSVPVVNFGTDERTGIKKVDLARMMTSFDRYLLDRGQNRMQRVCISLSVCKSETTKKVSDDHSRVLKWIRNAVRCNVEELDLYFSHRVSSTFSWPSFIFHSQSLRSLSVSSGVSILEVVEAPSLSFSSNLHYLSLSSVKIVDDRVFKWISCCCKCLKELRLISINGIPNISIESSSLVNFYVFECGDIHLVISGQKLEYIDMDWGGYDASTSRKSTISNTSLTIFAPNLKTLKWKGELRNSQSLGNLKSLEEALYKEGSTPTLILDNIRNLSIHCESLNNKFVPALVSLLRRMPNLNILCIKTRCWKLTYRTASRFGNEYWKLQNLAFIHQLKEVSIENSYGSNEIEFARYILEHAQNLKKMVIVHRDQNAPSIVSGMLLLSSIEGVQNISIESSSLESFSFFNYGDVHLGISGEKLENIVMAWSGCYVPTSLKSSTSLKIFAPNLKNLKWDGNLRNSQDLGKLKSLERVEICLKPQKNEFGKLVEVLCSICSAKVLIIHAKTVKVRFLLWKNLQALYKEGSTPTLILDNICNLSIHCESLNNKLVPALVSLLRRMPNLNILCIKTRCENLIPRTASRFGNEYWERQNLAFIHQLKEVSIENSYGSNEIEFARYILEHAPNLKKMVIVHRDDDAPSKVAGMVSRSKMISTASVLIRQDPHQIYKFRGRGSCDSYWGPDILKSGIVTLRSSIATQSSMF